MTNVIAKADLHPDSTGENNRRSSCGFRSAGQPRAPVHTRLGNWRNNFVTIGV